MDFFGDDLLVEVLHLPLSQFVHLNVDCQVGLLLVKDDLTIRKKLLLLHVDFGSFLGLTYRRLQDLVFVPSEICLFCLWMLGPFLGV